MIDFIWPLLFIWVTLLPWGYLLFLYHKKRSDLTALEKSWENAHKLTGYSIHALKYGFHNYSLSSCKLVSSYQSENISTNISLLWWFLKDSEIVKTYNLPRYQIQEHIVITNNYTVKMKIFHKMIYYITMLCWIISIICILPTVGISLLCMITIAILTDQSNKYINFIQILGQQSMESLWFEKSFDAFSKNPIEARMIITPAFMDRLEQFNNKWKLDGKVRIVLEKNLFTFLIKWNIDKYGIETDEHFTLAKDLEEMLNLDYYSLNTNNQ